MFKFVKSIALELQFVRMICWYIETNMEKNDAHKIGRSTKVLLTKLKQSLSSQGCATEWNKFYQENKQQFYENYTRDLTKSLKLIKMLEIKSILPEYPNKLGNWISKLIEKMKGPKERESNLKTYKNLNPKTKRTKYQWKCLRNEKLRCKSILLILILKCRVLCTPPLGHKYWTLLNRLITHVNANFDYELLHLAQIISTTLPWE